MNWVGGSRSRVLIKQERRKQKEYFERNKLRSKMKLMGVLSPVKNSTVSLDLLNLYMVNQISCKKKTPDTLKKPTHVDMNRDLKIPLRKHDLELPMSPHCTPSKLCIDDIENNMPFHRLGSKEESGAVQSSQDRNSYRMLGPQLNRIENCSYPPPCFPTELPYNRHITKQNVTPRTESSHPKFAYEKQQNDQLSIGNSSDSLVFKFNQTQDVFTSSYKIAQFGTLFDRSNSSENGDFITEGPAVIMREGCGGLQERQPDFIFGRQSLQHIWNHNGKKISKFFEDVNQTTQIPLSENHDSFVRQNMINLLNVDQQRMKETFDTCRYNSLGGICTDNSDKSNFTGGCDRGIFTVSESVLSNSSFASYPEKCKSRRSCQKEYNNNEINELSMSFEKDCYATSCGKKGKLKNDHQEKVIKENSQEYPVNLMDNTVVEELYAKQSCDFGLSEIPMEGRRPSSLKGTPVSTKKIYQCLDSSQSSQSASYSPRATDSCCTSSSDMLSEDEDLLPQQIEDPDEMSRKATKTTSSFYLERMSKHVGEGIVKDSAKVHKQNENLHPFSVENTAHQFPQSQCSSEDMLHTTSNYCILQVATCDAGVQTQSEFPMEGKLDVAIQCTLISDCICRSDVSSLCNTESHSENDMADTTGGQEILKNN